MLQGASTSSTACTRPLSLLILPADTCTQDVQRLTDIIYVLYKKIVKLCARSLHCRGQDSDDLQIRQA